MIKWHIHYGACEKNPVDSMHFYPKVTRPQSNLFTRSSICEKKSVDQIKLVDSKGEDPC